MKSFSLKNQIFDSHRPDDVERKTFRALRHGHETDAHDVVAYMHIRAEFERHKFRLNFPGQMFIAGIGEVRYFSVGFIPVIKNGLPREDAAWRLPVHVQNLVAYWCLAKLGPKVHNPCFPIVSCPGKPT